MKNIGLGLIGLGSMGNIHLQHALRLRGARLVAVADVSKIARAKARSRGVKKTYSDYNELLKDSEVDAVIIALPTHLHLQSARQAAEAGKHVFLEKPLAKNVEEGKELISAIRSNSVRLMVGYPTQFNEQFRRLKEKMQNGELGHVEVAYATNIGPGPFTTRADVHSPIPVPEWWFNKELTGGGVLMDLGCHVINLLQWYFGALTDVRSLLEYRFNLDLEDSAVCFARFASGTRAIINVGWFSQSFQSKVEVSGSMGHLTAQYHPANPLLNIIHLMTRGTSIFNWPYFIELQYFADCLNKEKSPSPSAEDGLRDLKAIDLAYKNVMDLKV